MAKTREELAYCGEDCEVCEIYRATLFGDALKPETIKRWQEDFKKYHGIESVEPEQLKCRGCRSEGEDDFYGFKLCPIRGCCKSHELSSCGLCPDLKTCAWQPDGSKNLEGIADTENNP